MQQMTMDRRRFLCGCSLLALSSVQALADIRRLGFISSSTTTIDSSFLVALREGLKARGYTEGQNLAIDYQFAHSTHQLPGLAHQLVQKPVEVIIAAGSEGIVAAMNATTTIPIVMTNSGDAVREGFATTLARPGGNITGMTQISPELAGKRLEMLLEIFSDLQRVGILWNSIHPNTPITFQEATAATEKLGLVPVSFELKAPEEIEKQLQKAAEQSVRGFLVIRDPFTIRNRVRIVNGLHRHNMLAVFETPEFVDAGGLMSFGADFAQLFRESATYVDRILKGASPANLPIQQPTKFSLVINARVAHARGVKIPQSLLVRADHVIE
jgi:putative tryptophan/tyrosine transport system substrate-binding protein